MSALAHSLVDLGCAVSGSDLSQSEITTKLIALGVKVYVDHAASNVTSTQLIVVSDAIPSSNVELSEARIRAIPVISRAECLDLLCKSKSAIMISGAHGKTTTAAMFATLLDQTGAEPSFIIGANVPILGNRRGRIAPGKHFVVEACEAFQNLTKYHPDVAVITNIDNEHVDHYGSQDKLDAAFLAFANRATIGIVANGDDIGVERIIRKMTSPVTTFGFNETNQITITRLELDANGSRFDLRIGNQTIGTVFLPIPGRHMVMNALACIACAQLLGIKFDAIAAGVARFTGAQRRWQRYDAAGRIQLIDDFAHHPAEIATIADTARILLDPNQRLVIAFQPQLFSRTRRLVREFGRQLAKFDTVFLLDIDGAGERDPGDISSSLIASEIRKCGGTIEPFEDVDDLVRRGPELLMENDCLITAGAGSIRHAARRLASHYRAGQAMFAIPTAAPTMPPALSPSSINLTAHLPHMARGTQPPDATVLTLLLEQIARHPDRTAVSDGNRRISYAGLDVASDCLAQLLRDNGVSHDDVVGVRLRSSLELIVLLVGLAKIGAVYLPLDLSLPTERASFMLGKATARLLVTASDPPFETKTNELRVLGLDRIQHELAQPQSSHPTLAAATPQIVGGDLAYICFTSGSTGQPKGVAIRHSSLANLVLGIRDLFGINRDTRMILNTSISFDVSMGEIWMTLCGGGELRATGSLKPLIGERLGEFIEQNAITHIAITPTVLTTLSWHPLPSLRCIISAGEACPQTLIDRWAPDREFFNAYGPTEATVYATVARCPAGAEVTIGKPLPNVIARVLDADLCDLGCGKEGELYLGGAGVVSGYIDLEAETRERFIDWSDRPGLTERLYRTGDTVRQHIDGSLTYLGRIDSQIKILGNRVELEEIEQTIMRHTSIIDVAVSFDERAGFRELICFPVMNSEDEFDWATVRDRLSKWLPAYMIPSVCVPVNEITLTVSGKKDRRSLLSSYRRKTVQRAEYSGPRNDLEAKVAAIWKSLLGAETDIGVDENFAWLGGDSLKGLQLVMEIEKAFGIRVPPGYFGGFTTIQRMSVQIADLLWTYDEQADDAATGFRSSRVYKQLRDITTGWNGSRASSDSIIVSSGSTTHVYDLFLCVQMEEELHSIATHLGPSFRVHAMRSGHMVMDYTPEATNALCEHYIEELEKIRPTGKLLIGGICQGGLIAAAMANLIRERGYDIHLLILMEQSQLIPYEGEIAFFYSEDSFVNPYRRFSSGLARYDEIYGSRYSLDLVPGIHGNIHAPPNVQMLVPKLQARLAGLPGNEANGKPDDEIAKAAMTLEKVANLQQDLTRVEAEFEKLRQENVALRVELAGIYCSKTWRISRWLKAVEHGVNRYLKPTVAWVVSAKDVRLIEGSRMFDAQYYVDQLVDEKGGAMSPARHYALHGWRKGLDPGRLFNTTGYLARNPDVLAANVNPLVHYLRFGVHEGRIGWSEQDLLVWQRDLFDRPDVALRETQLCTLPGPVLRRGDLVCIHAHSQGHFVFQQFQQMIGQAFTSVGVDCVLADETPPARERRPAVRIVVAPHDFYHLEGGPAPGTPEFAGAIPINTEQMPSIWFAKAMPFLMKAPFVLDINVQTAASLVRLGVNAQFLPLGLVPENEIFHLQTSLPREATVRGLPPVLAKAPAVLDGPLESRGIDILLIGSNSERRQRFVVENSRFFASKNCFIRLVNVRGALTKSNPQSVSALAFAGLAQRSKILLNVHHFSTPYFEWQRLMHYGLMQCCCVVTERSSRVPGLVPGKHYFEDELNKLPALLEWLLNDKDGREQADVVRRMGYEAAITQFQLSRTLCDLFRIEPGEGLRGN